MKWSQIYRTALIASLSLFIATASRAGTAINWWTVDGGGGISQGGGYKLQGTIGQFDAGDKSSNLQGVTLQGGYWSAEPLTLTLPQLTIVLQPSGQVQVSWGSDAAGYHVEVSYDLQSWDGTGFPQIIVPGNLTNTPSAVVPKKFYRLRK